VFVRSMTIIYLPEIQQHRRESSKVVFIASQLPNESQLITGWGRFFSDRVGDTFMSSNIQSIHEPSKPTRP
jgi:hypothetical protein